MSTESEQASLTLRKAIDLCQGHIERGSAATDAIWMRAFRVIGDVALVSTLSEDDPQRLPRHIRFGPKDSDSGEYISSRSPFAVVDRFVQEIWTVVNTDPVKTAYVRQRAGMLLGRITVGLTPNGPQRLKAISSPPTLLYTARKFEGAGLLHSGFWSIVAGSGACVLYPEFRTATAQKVAQTPDALQRSARNDKIIITTPAPAKDYISGLFNHLLTSADQTFLIGNVFSSALRQRVSKTQPAPFQERTSAPPTLPHEHAQLVRPFDGISIFNLTQVAQGLDPQAIATPGRPADLPAALEIILTKADTQCTDNTRQIINEHVLIVRALLPQIP